MNSKTQTAGYSLVEVLVSIGVLLIAIVGPMTIAAQGIRSASFALEQNTAFFLAQEGAELVFALRNDAALVEYQSIDSGSPSETSWDWVNDELNNNGPCALNSNGDTCSFGLDARDDSLGSNFNSDTDECDSGNEDRCVLYKDTSNARSVYSHDSGGEETRYTRIITITRQQDDVLDITATVTWESDVFGGAEQSVEVSSELQDLTFDVSSL